MLEPQLLVINAHLAANMAAPVAEIEADGTPIAARIPIFEIRRGAAATADTAAYAIGQFSRWFWEHRPACCLVLGDRYESCARPRPRHIPGAGGPYQRGDVTLGAADDWYRHCITKIAPPHLTSPSCAEYAARECIARRRPPCSTWGLGDEEHPPDGKAAPRTALQSRALT